MKHYGRNNPSCCSSAPFQSSLCRKWPYLLIISSLIGLCLIAFFKWMAFDWLIDQKIAQKLQLLPGTETFEQWMNIPVPIIMKFRIFNVTNPIEVQNGAKPQLVEAGPYAYEEKRIKEVISMDSEKDTITYKQRIIYTFRPDLSNGSEYDRLVVINVPFVTLSKLTYDNVGNFSFAHAMADRNMRQRGERLFTFATVKEYMFDGYSVQHYLNFLKSPAITLIGGVKIPKSIATGRFGFYYGKNATDDGEYVIRTGKTNPQEFGQIVSYNGKTKLDYYYGACNLINGTDGSLAPPFLTKETHIRFFSSDICRSIFAVFRNETEVKGVKAYRFKMPNAKKIFDKKGFCFCPTGKNNECFKHGVLSMAPCRDGAPIAMSSVHFLEAYEPYLKNVQGLNPKKEIHETFLDIEPKTGLILRAAKRVQFNVMVTRNRDMSTFSQVRSTMFPFMWVEEVVETTDAFIDNLNKQLFRPIEIVNKASIGLLISFTILILLGALGCVSISPRKRKTNSVTSDNSDSFHEVTNRDTSRSRTGSINSVRTLGHLSLQSGSSSQAKSLGSITSFTSKATMTSENKGTMTDGPFNMYVEVEKLKNPSAEETEQTIKQTPLSMMSKNIIQSMKPSFYFPHGDKKKTEGTGVINSSYQTDSATDPVTST